MSYYQGRDKRKPTGGTLHHFREKRKYELGSSPTETTLGTDADSRKPCRCFGGNLKMRLDQAAYANVTDVKTNATKKVKILKVKTNPSNVDYARRGVITKGAIIETELGDARVSSRPGQDGVLNAILMK
ncbi:MAG: 30S ribosomal protein S8e [Candidatus Verstraetearchaeota archaeon]|nr:30S ribosomal protein S8e [Candidatus Verstraetearchaeota archaeon]